jgi:hypothetical protein
MIGEEYEQQETLDQVLLKHGDAMRTLETEFPDFFPADDPFLSYRFLKARDFDEDKARDMVNASVQFGKDNNLQAIRDTVKDTPDPHQLPYAKQVMQHYPHE